MSGVLKVMFEKVVDALSPYSREEEVRKTREYVERARARRERIGDGGANDHAPTQREKDAFYGMFGEDL